MESCNSSGGILPAENFQTQTFLTDYSPKDKPWDEHKVFNGKVLRILEGSHNDSHHKQAKRMLECAQHLEFSWVLVSSDTGEIKLRLKNAWFCRVRHCPICQWRRSLMWLARFFDAFPRIYAAYPEMRYIMLTLTVRNCSISELRSTVNQMNTAWKRLSQRKSFPALGFVRSLEVTRGDDGSAHPHFHVLLAVNPSYFKGGSYLSKDKWAALWQDAMRLDYKPVCDVRIVKSRKKTAEIQELSDFEALMSAITETIKYTTKPSDMVKQSSWLLEMVEQMHKVRAVAIGGIFKAFLKETEDNQDLITGSDVSTESDLSDGSLLFEWRKQVKRYVKKS